MSTKKVKFICKAQENSEISLTFEHAENLLTLQEKNGRADWKLSEGQKLTWKNGKLTNKGTSTGEDK